MHRWLRQGWRVLALFILSFSQFLNLSAQDAFYVYRNDGDFNGFFYDEVVRMFEDKVGKTSGTEYELIDAGWSMKILANISNS